MADYKKQRNLNIYTMMASGVALGAVSLLGDGQGAIEDSILITSYLGCIGTGINSIRLGIIERRRKKTLKGRL